MRVCPAARSCTRARLNAPAALRSGSSLSSCSTPAKAVRLVARAVAPAASSRYRRQPGIWHKILRLQDIVRSDLESRSASVEKVGSRSLKEIRRNDDAIFDLVCLPPQIDCGRLGLIRSRGMRSPASVSKVSAHDAEKIRSAGEQAFSTESAQDSDLPARPLFRRSWGRSGHQSASASGRGGSTRFGEA